MTSVSALRLSLLAALLCGAACNTHTLPPTFPEPKEPTAEQVLATLLASKRPVDSAVAVGVSADGEQLMCWDLATGKSRWSVSASPTTAPILVGEQVVTQEGDEVVLRSLADGQAAMRMDADGVLVGADGSGDVSVLSILHDDGSRHRASVVLVEAGSVRWRVRLNLPVGRPALMGGYVIAPWATHRVSILDAHSGAERVRWFFTGTVLGHAQVQGGRIYVGQHGFIPVTHDMLKLQAGDAAPLGPKPRQLPGHPAVLRDGYAAYPPPGSAEHRLRLHWRVGPDREQPVLRDRAYLRFYRVVFGMRASADELLWVRHFEQDLVGAAQTADGLWLADAAGTLRFVDTEGQVRDQVSLGKSLSMLTLRGEPGAGGHSQPAQGAPAAEGVEQPGAPGTSDVAEAAGSAGAADDLTAQLTAIAQLDDTRLGAARAYAVEWLAKRPDGAVTRTLVDLCVQDSSPEPVHRAACRALEGRERGHEHVLSALKPSRQPEAASGHVGALSLVASKLRLRKAVPSMLAHFEDLRTDTRDLMALAEAFESITTPAATAALERFVRMHHGEPEGSSIVPVVTRSIETLGGMRAKHSRKLLLRLSQDGLSSESVRSAAAGAVQRIDSPPSTPDKTAAPAEKGPGPAGGVARPADVEPPADTRPARLEPGLVAAALKPVARKLRRCVRGGDGVASARIAMVITGQGQVEGVYVTPPDLQACVEPLVRGQGFPATRAGRQRVTHTVRAK